MSRTRAAHALLTAAHALMCRHELREADVRLRRAGQVIAAANHNALLEALHQCRKAWRAFLEDSSAGDKQALNLVESALASKQSLVRAFALATRGIVMASRGENEEGRHLLHDPHSADKVAIFSFPI